MLVSCSTDPCRYGDSIVKAWTLHWLAASGNLEDHRPAITRAFGEAYQALSAIMAPPELDVLIQRQDNGVIAEVGFSGRAYRSDLFAVTCDPSNPRFSIHLENGGLARTIVHEVHHCLRMGGPGYGSTLGEALVSEGLAGRFVAHLFQSRPEPWEAAVALPTLKALKVGKSTLAAPRYDHADWFFGRGSLPRWAGYSLGYQIVGEWLAASAADDRDWINVRAEIPIGVAIERGLIGPD